jgi:glycosyltransferase involved in cell wall biosynthesis
VRIALVGPAHPFKGGVAQHTTQLAHRLAAAGHQTRIVSWRRQYPRRFYPGLQAVEDPELPIFDPTRRVLSWDRPDTWLRTGRTLRAMDLVVFAHVTAFQVPAYWTVMTTLRQHAQSVVICHNVLPHERRPGDRWATQRFLSSADGVVVHSHQEADIARILTPRPVRVAPLAPHFPASFVRSSPLRGEHRRLIFFGLVRPYKGLDVLLRAMAQGPPDLRLRVAGEFWGGPAQTERLCRELGIAERVEFHPGYVASTDVPALFRDVDALVLPYREATGSQAVWTGFQFGVPVLATRAGSLAEGVRDGVDGLVSEPDDVESLAAALHRFYRPGEPERLRANVRPVDGEQLWHQYLSSVGLARSTRLASHAEASIYRIS